MRYRATVSWLLPAGTVGCLAVVVLACAVLIACGGASPTSPSTVTQGPLGLSAQITRNLIPAGEVATLTFRLQNLSSDTVTLNFPDSCQFLIYVANASGATVYPPGGSWFCAQMLTNLTLAARESVTRELKVGGYGPPLDSMAPLPAGGYSAYARIASNEYKLESTRVNFRIQ